MMMRSSPYSTTIMFLPISPNPPSGMMRSGKPLARRGGLPCLGLLLLIHYDPLHTAVIARTSGDGAGGATRAYVRPTATMLHPALGRQHSGQPSYRTRRMSLRVKALAID